MSKAAPRTIGGYRVDTEAIQQLAYHCDPGICRDTTSCCACYEITVAPGELSRIIGMMPWAEAYVPDLRSAHPFDDSEDGTFAIDTDEKGRCLFAYRDINGRKLCSLHSAASEIGKDPYACKPSSCSLWPLALSEDEPPWLTVMSDAYGFPCCRQRREPGLDPGTAEHVRRQFGADFLAELQTALRE
jgi:hypothetical protein